jgi:hypothetical protein
MKKAELTKLLNNVKFWLRNYEQTKNKYDGKFTEYDNDIENLSPNYSSIESMFYNSNQIKYSGYMITWLKEALKTWKKLKQSIKCLKTFINNITIEVINNDVRFHTWAKSTRPYAVKVYLNNYNKINNLMREFLTDYVLSANETI